MRVMGDGMSIYLYVNGIWAEREVLLGQYVALLPARCQVSADTLAKLTRTQIELGIATALLPCIGSQLRVTADNPNDLSTRAWNSLWDVVLLSALFDVDAACNFKSAVPVEELCPSSMFVVTNGHFRGLGGDPRRLTEEDHDWLEANMPRARALMECPPFLDVVHCLASYRWHSHPRAQLAVIWAGIEGLFDIQSELVFRLSQFCARFLEPDDRERQIEVYETVRSLYKQRSTAVHGGALKGEPRDQVRRSAELLSRLVHRCIEIGGLPDVSLLAP